MQLSVSNAEVAGSRTAAAEAAAEEAAQQCKAAEERAAAAETALSAASQRLHAAEDAAEQVLLHKQMYASSLSQHGVAMQRNRSIGTSCGCATLALSLEIRSWLQFMSSQLL